ncbi:MAG: ornithine cyclodeaminase family protein, partial [Bacteroidota bacterium]
DAKTGVTKAIMEANSLTAQRTAAASALASSLLSNASASSLLMIGTGALASRLIRAHASVRPIRQVYVWGRNFAKAKAVCQQLGNEVFQCSPIQNIVDKISEVDIISCATLSPDPLVMGKYLRPGQHIDLVGAYKKDTRESDDEVMKKGVIFVDTFGGSQESGDIYLPLRAGIIQTEDIKGDLFSLCSGESQARKNEKEITVFKSVGHALEDLAAASYYYKQFKN